VDAEAVITLALEYDKMKGSGDNLVLRPFQAWNELVRLAVTSSRRIIKRGAVSPFGNIWRIGRRVMVQSRRQMNCISFDGRRSG
jgi:hypothetical protein